MKSRGLHLREPGDAESDAMQHLAIWITTLFIKKALMRTNSYCAMNQNLDIWAHNIYAQHGDDWGRRGRGDGCVC